MKNVRSLLLFAVIVTIISAVLFRPHESFSIYKATGSTSETISVANFDFKLNGSASVSQSIDLQSTITANDYSNDYVMPGTNGVITLVLDFTGVDVSSDYIISMGEANLPTNLKLYTDSSYSNELTSIDGLYSVDGETSYTHNIYWKWIYSDDGSSDANDNLFMNTTLTVPIDVVVSQVIGGGN